ncbi:MAG: beta-ketoacyl synthase N-terminal-like domain-containing protein, partial [Rhodobacteraceae bacterium]|nr:beta-ketoacyl synthase N-terminal-like domain-containing protein [Paracoccaceae bacterium]
MRRVVITGMGLVSPLANGVKPTWERLLNGDSAAQTIRKFDADHLGTNYACEIPRQGPHG